MALQFYLGANFIHTVLSWRSDAKEVELAQKKADNFWQQRYVIQGGPCVGYNTGD